MEHFFTHLPYLAIAAFFIALLGIVAVIAANKSAEEDAKHPEWDDCKVEGCAGCKFFSMCKGMNPPRQLEQEE